MSAGDVSSPCDPDDVVNDFVCFDGDLPRYRYRNRNQRTLILNCSHRQVEVYDIYSTLSYNQFSHYPHERFQYDEIKASNEERFITFGTLLAHSFVVNNILAPSDMAIWSASSVDT